MSEEFSSEAPDTILDNTQVIEDEAHLKGVWWDLEQRRNYMLRQWGVTDPKIEAKKQAVEIKLLAIKLATP